MREIKFRAWNKEDEEMYYTGNYGSDEELYMKRHVVISGFEHDSGWDFEDFEIMQYTGLKDKNGVDIYEGDIIDFSLYNKSKYYFESNTGFVAFDKEGADYNLLNLQNEIIFGFGLEKQVYEVIGNIHENPELLED